MPIRFFLVAWLLFSCIGGLWSFASPLMSVPDEPAHAIKAAAVARGQLSGTSSGIQGEPLTVSVPGYIADLGLYSCFAQNSGVTPACAAQIRADDRGWRAAATSAGNYNPVYYAIVGIGSRGLSGEPAIYAMRLINSGLVSFFLAGIFFAAASLRHFRRPVIAAAVALTPSVFFLTGAINPNALEIAATGAVFMSLCAVLEQTAGRIRVSPFLLGILTFSGALLAHTRPMSLLWLAVAVLSAVLCYRIRTMVEILQDRRFQLSVAVVSLSCLLAVGWVVTANSFDSLLAGSEPIPADEAFVTMLDRTLVFMAEYVGVLGWLDTLPPTAAVYAWVLGFGALLFLATTARPVRARWVIAFLAATIIFVPAGLQASSSEELGWIWQGRYALAIVLTLILAAGMATRFRAFRVTPWNKSMVRWGIVLGVLAHTYVLLEGFRRYTVGIEGLRVNWTEMFDPKWQPPGTWQALTLTYIAVLTVAGVCLYRVVTAPPLPAQRVEPAPSPAAGSINSY